MKQLMLPLFVCLLVGCGKEHIEIASIDPSVQPIVDKFIAEGQKRGINIDVSDVSIKFMNDISQYSDTESNKAVCDTRHFDKPTILIANGFWQTSYDGTREHTIFHELGHCVLNREHMDLQQGKVPLSIMNSHFNNISYYFMYRDQYMNELFHPKAIFYWELALTKDQIAGNTGYDMGAFIKQLLSE